MFKCGGVMYYSMVGLLPLINCDSVNLVFLKVSSVFGKESLKQFLEVGITFFDVFFVLL